MKPLSDQIASAALGTLRRGLGRMSLSSREVSGCALLTDDDLAVVHLSFVTNNEVLKSKIGHMQLRPAEWEPSEADLFDDVNRRLRSDAWGIRRTPQEIHERASVVFEQMVEALASVRVTADVPTSAFMTVCSTDPSELTSDLERRFVRRLNPDDVVVARFFRARS